MRITHYICTPGPQFQQHRQPAVLHCSRFAPMHRCLYIVEVAEAVCEHIFLLKEGSSTLLAFGLTCHVLLEPALARLWETQTNLSPLMRTLPGESWTYFGKDIVVS